MANFTNEERTDTNPPLVGIGLFFRNEDEYLFEAISSILNQTYTNIRVVLLDDASGDQSSKIACEFAASDDRVSLITNQNRTGYSDSYRSTFLELSSKCKYFAWASGHDKHEKTWLETLVRTMENDDSIAVAYPSNNRIDKFGKVVRTEVENFSATQCTPLRRLWHVFNRGNNFGNIIYGVFRADHLITCGIYRPVLVADAVLIWELAIVGKIHQLNEKLWNRRHDYFEKADRKSVRSMIARQKKNMFAKAPWYTNLPWWLANGFAISMSWATSRYASPTQRFLGVVCGILFTIKNARWL